MAARIGFRTGYEGDEVAVGIALAIALHALPIAVLAIKAAYPSNDAPEQSLVAKPVIAASLLKLGKPLDPKKLPDRIAPVKSTTNIKDPVASQNDPTHDKPDAGPPPPNAELSDLQKLMNKTDPFAEDAGKPRVEEGFANGSDAGVETDPSKVHAGDLYASQLDAFLRTRWNIPSVISQGDENRLCVQYQINISPRMVVWHMNVAPTKKSGNDLYDDSARGTLQKLLDDRTPLPDPPAEIAELYRGRTVIINMGKGCK
ncbi:MAG: TonB C-terminal domain-containing protein [Polyangiaceae bacterium]